MGGAQYQAKRIVEALIERGDSEIYYLARRISPQSRANGYHIRQIGQSKLQRFILDAPTLLRTLEELEPDTIYSRVGCAYTGIAAYYARKRSCRLIWHIASEPDVQPWNEGWLGRFRFRYIDKLALEFGLRRADVIVAQTQDQSRLLEQNYGRTATEVIPNFHPPAAEHIEKAHNAVEVLWIANLKQIKQPEVFLAVAQALRNLPAHFVMIGANQLMGHARTEVERSMAMLDNFEYLGEITNEEVNARLAMAHLLVNTSKAEGFSNTFIQAWMREVPVLSLNVNPDGLLTDGALGACAAGQVNELIELVRTWVNDSNLRQQTGQHAKQYAHNRFGNAGLERIGKLLHDEDE